MDSRGQRQTVKINSRNAVIDTVPVTVQLWPNLPVPYGCKLIQGKLSVGGQVREGLPLDPESLNYSTQFWGQSLHPANDFRQSRIIQSINYWIPSFSWDSTCSLYLGPSIDYVTVVVGIPSLILLVAMIQRDGKEVRNGKNEKSKTWSFESIM